MSGIYSNDVISDVLVSGQRIIKFERGRMEISGVTGDISPLASVNIAFAQTFVNTDGVIPQVSVSPIGPLIVRIGSETIDVAYSNMSVFNGDGTYALKFAWHAVGRWQ